MPRDILELPAPLADMRLPYGDDPNQFVDFRFPAGTPRGLVVHIHGGFWRNRFNLLHGGHVCAALTAAGLVTANIEYRRVGDPGGGWPGTVQDAVAAVRFARSRVGAKLPAVVTGHSAGGHLALWIASESHDLAGVVALAPVACLDAARELNLGSGAVDEFLAGTPASEACPSSRASRVRRTLIHGTADEIVPISLSRMYVEARGSDPWPPRLIELPGADHFDVIDPRSGGWSPVVETVLGLCTLART